MAEILTAAAVGVRVVMVTAAVKSFMPGRGWSRINTVYSTVQLQIEVFHIDHC